MRLLKEHITDPRLWRWIGCFGAIVAAIGLTLCGVALWNAGLPVMSIVILLLALVALVFALWQYTVGRGFR